MTAKTKYPVLDENFLPKMIDAAEDEVQRGMIYILYYTGMHGSSLRELTPDSIKKEGSRVYLEWRRPKTNKTLRAQIPFSKIAPIEVFLFSKKKSLRWYNHLLKTIGERAGYDGVSTMTFRHTRAVTALREGYSIYEIPHLMGCTLEVAARNYTKLREDQLMRHSKNLEDGTQKDENSGTLPTSER